jgi:hypothetical protein
MAGFMDQASLRVQGNTCWVKASTTQQSGQCLLGYGTFATQPPWPCLLGHGIPATQPRQQCLLGRGICCHPALGIVCWVKAISATQPFYSFLARHAAHDTY